MIKVYEVSRKYIMLFTHNNRYLALTGLLTLLLIQPAPVVHREIFEIFHKCFTKYFMKYFTPKKFMKFYTTSYGTKGDAVNKVTERRTEVCSAVQFPRCMA